jgi:two-component system, NarL family, nitrate/nitrite response regulator NarL
MSAADFRAKQHLDGGGHSVRTVRIVLITSEPLYREGIRSAIRSTQSLILLDAKTITDAVELAKSRLADMVVIEATSLRHAIEMARPVATYSPEMPIVAMIGSATSDDVRSAFASGIRGCVLKQVEARELVGILENIFRGGLYLPAELREALLRQCLRINGKSQEKANGYRLTPRELQILAGVARALTNKEVARELQISEKTVKRYMTVIMKKLDVRNRLEAVLKAKAVD